MPAQMRVDISLTLVGTIICLDEEASDAPEAYGYSCRCPQFPCLPGCCLAANSKHHNNTQPTYYVKHWLCWLQFGYLKLRLPSVQ